MTGVAALAFGTWGSQVQILPLRPILGGFFVRIRRRYRHRYVRVRPPAAVANFSGAVRRCVRVCEEGGARLPRPKRPKLSPPVEFRWTWGTENPAAGAGEPAPQGVLVSIPRRLKA